MTWNVTDNSSWLRNHPAPHVTWPLLFDGEGKPETVHSGYWPSDPSPSRSSPSLPMRDMAKLLREGRSAADIRKLLNPCHTEPT